MTLKTIWCDAKVTKVHHDGTYDVRFDEGDKEAKVRLEFLRSDRMGGGVPASRAYPGRAYVWRLVKRPTSRIITLQEDEALVPM